MPALWPRSNAATKGSRPPPLSPFEPSTLAVRFAAGAWAGPLLPGWAAAHASGWAAPSVDPCTANCAGLEETCYGSGGMPAPFQHSSRAGDGHDTVHGHLAKIM